MYQSGFMQNRGQPGFSQGVMNDGSSMPMRASYSNEGHSSHLASQQVVYGHPHYSTGMNQFARRPLQPVQLPSNDTVLSQHPLSRKPPHLQATFQQNQHSQLDYYEFAAATPSSQNPAMGPGIGPAMSPAMGPAMGPGMRYQHQPIDYYVDPYQGYGPPQQDPREAFYGEEDEGLLVNHPVQQHQPVARPQMQPMQQHAFIPGQRASHSQQQQPAAAMLPTYSAFRPQRASSPCGSRGPLPKQEAAEAVPAAATATTSSFGRGPRGLPELSAQPGAAERPVAPRGPSTPSTPAPQPPASALQQTQPSTSSDSRRDLKAAPPQDNGLRVLTGTVDQILSWGRKVEEAVRPEILFEMIGSLDSVRRGPLHSSFLVTLRALEGGATLQGVFWEIDRPLLVPEAGSTVSCVCRLGPRASSAVSSQVRRPQLPRLQVLKISRVQDAQLKHLKRITYASSHAVQQGALQAQQAAEPTGQQQDKRKQALISSYVSRSKLEK